MDNITVKLISLLLLLSSFGHSLELNVHLHQPGHDISSTLWGVFFEEINHGGDGGLYGELVQNRGLSTRRGDLEGYSVYKPNASGDATMTFSTDQPLNAVLNASLQLTVTSPVGLTDRIGVANTGYWGIPIRPDYTFYTGSFYARTTSPTFTGPLTVAIGSLDGSIVYASAVISGTLTAEFQKYEFVLTPSANLIQVPTLDAQFVIYTTGQSVQVGDSFNFNMISLFPPTWNNKPNGLRVDLAERIAAAKPSFVRFPGGAFVHGYSMATRWNWEEAIGPLEQRPGHWGLWGYYCSDGLGLLEGVEFAEDLGVEVVLGVFAGNTGEDNSVPIDEIGRYVESALNNIEYLTGNTTTVWGTLRAQHGHPEPFKLTYVEIGNEDYFTPDYDVRFPFFYDAIKERYPELTVIATARVESRTLDMLDEHFWSDVGEWPANMHHFYDDAPRDGPQIYVGEYATRFGQSIDFGGYHEAILAAAIDDASFMIGLERNGDIVRMASYAPLLAHVEDYRWTPDTTYFNGIQSFGTPAWWVQHLFSSIRGNTNIPTDSDSASPRIFHGAAVNRETNKLVLRIVNAGGTVVELDVVELVGIGGTLGGNLTVLTGGGLDFNTLQEPMKVAPKMEPFTTTAATFNYTVPPYSLSIFEIQLL